MLAKLLGFLEQFQESTLAMVALAQFNFQLFGHLFMHFIVVVQLVEIVHELLVILDCQVRLHFLHVFYLLLVAGQLLLHFGNHFITRFISLFYIIVPPVELLRLVLHRCE